MRNAPRALALGVAGQRDEAKSIHRLPKKIAIASYAWPDNMRELAKRLPSAFLLAEPDAPLHLQSLEPGQRPENTRLFREARARSIAEFEHRYRTTLLRRVGGNMSMSRASRESGKERIILIRLLRTHGLKRDHFA